MRWWRWGLAAAGSAVIILVLVARGALHPAAIAATLAQLRPRAVALALLAVLGQTTFIAARLWCLFPPPRPGWWRTSHAYATGEVLNMVVPARVGDAVKVMLVAEPEVGRTAAEAVGVLIADATVNLVVLLVLVIAVGPGYLVGLAAGSTLRLVIASAVIVAVAAFAWSARRRPSVRRAFAGLAALRRRRLVGGLLLSLGNWTMEIIAVRYFVGQFGGELAVADCVRLLFLLNVGLAFNVSIANVGSFEVPFAIGLGAAGIAFDRGIAIGTGYHGLQLSALLLAAIALGVARRVAPHRFAARTAIEHAPAVLRSQRPAPGEL